MEAKAPLTRPGRIWLEASPDFNQCPFPPLFVSRWSFHPATPNKHVYPRYTRLHNVIGQPSHTSDAYTCCQRGARGA